MRRFSDELVEDREFEIGGEHFKWRYPYWEDWANRAEEDMKRGEDQPTDDGEKPTVKDNYQEFIDRIETFIDPENDAIKRWRTLAKRKVDPVPAYLLPELYVWLVGVTSARPIELPSPSENGQGQTEDTSTED